MVYHIDFLFFYFLFISKKNGSWFGPFPASTKHRCMIGLVVKLQEMTCIITKFTLEYFSYIYIICVQGDWPESDVVWGG